MKTIYLFLMVVLFCPVLAGSIPFYADNGLVEVDVIIDGRVKARFGIDTGADRIYIDQEFARKNELAFALPTPGRKVTGLDARTGGAPISLQLLEVAGVSVKSLKATAIDLRSFTGDGNSSHPDGLIGFDFLRRFFLSIDYPKGTLRLSAERPRFLDGNRYESLPFTMYGHLILLDVVINDEITAPMIVDYCASHTTLSPSLAKRLKTNVKQGISSVSEIAISRNIQSYDVTVFISDLAHYRKSAPRAKFEGILGGTFLKDHSITIDCDKKMLHIQTR